MKKADLLVFLFASALLSGCDTVRPQQATVMSSAEYAGKEPIATSLFPSDQAILSDEAVSRILSSKLEFPEKAKVALMKFPDGQAFGPRYYGSYYWQNEEYVKLQQAQVDTLSKGLLASDHIMEVIPLPSLMIPR